jgi:hypothetical protein
MTALYSPELAVRWPTMNVDGLSTAVDDCHTVASEAFRAETLPFGSGPN